MESQILGKSLLIVFLCMVSTLLSAQQVYKWIDDDGQVQYGDMPPEKGSEFTPVNILPGPSDAQKQQAEALKQQQSQMAEDYKAKREARQADKAKALEKKAGDEVALEEDNREETDQEKDYEPVYLPPCGSDLTAGRPCKSSSPIVKPRPPIVKPHPPVIRPRPQHPVAPSRPVDLPATR